MSLNAAATRRGRLTMVAFGGAGPVHVANLAAKLGIRRVLVPLRAGVLSALGLLLSPAAFDLKRTRKQPLGRARRRRDRGARGNEAR